MKLLSLAHQVFFKKRNSRESIAADAAKFICAFAMSGAVAYSVLLLTGNFLHKLAAHSSEFTARTLLGLPVASNFENYFPLLEGVANSTPFSAEINDLCTGRLELAVMAGLLIASRDKPLRERGKGILLGTLVLLLFNPLRIALTLYSIGTPFLAVVHDALFRLGLVLLLVVFYSLWYYWKAPDAKLQKNKRAAASAKR